MDYMMIQLSDNKTLTKVSNCDYAYLLGFDWFLQNKNDFRVARRIKGKRIYMSRDIMKPPDNMVVDHINGDCLDNRRENLRICTQSQNLRNAKLSRKNKYKLKGVYKHGKNWKASYFANNQYVYLGTFKCPLIAKLTYNKAVKSKFGEYAKI